MLYNTDLQNTISHFFYNIIEFIHHIGSKNFTALATISLIIMLVGAISNIIYIAQATVAVIKLILKKTRGEKIYNYWLKTSDITIPVSILIPAFNEKETILTSTYAALNFDYPNFEVIVINDGSTDNTLDIMIKEYKLFASNIAYEYAIKCKKIIQVYKSSIYKNLIIIDKQNANSRADAINAGINLSRNPIFCTIDADSIMSSNALLKTIQFFVQDERTIAAGGSVKVLNGFTSYKGEITKRKVSNNFVVLFQTLEYIRAFFIGRIFLNNLGILNLLSGTFAVIRKDLTLEIGGFKTDSMGEDYDITMRLHRHMIKKKQDYKIHFVPEAVCWTEVPDSLQELKKQRIRWHQGALEVFFDNKDMLFNPKYKKIGMLLLPIALLFDIFSPIAEIFSYIIVPILAISGLLNKEFFFLFIALLFFLNFFISVISLLLESIAIDSIRSPDVILKLALCAFIETFYYKIVNNFWKIIGWYYFLTNKKKWVPIKRNPRPN